jgi:hypothetical protein
MLKHFLATSFITFLSLIVIANWSVDAKTNVPEKTVSIEAVRKLVALDIGAQEDSIEIVKKGKVLTITRINSSLNESSHQNRNEEAASIMAVVVKAIADVAEYNSLYSIAVHYTRRTNASSKTSVFDTIEFRKNQKGEFEIHLT